MATVIKKETVTSYVLELDADEAAAVMALVGTLGGSSNYSPRRHTKKIYEALNRAGVSTKFSDKLRTHAYWLDEE